MMLPSSLHSQPINNTLLLENLAKANKQTQWILSNCQVVPKTFLTKLFFYTIAYLCPCTKNWIGINLEQSKQYLKRIGKQEINKKHFDQVLLFNRSVYQFNSIAPRHQLPQLQSQILEGLIAEAIKKPVIKMNHDLLHDPKPCEKQEIDSFLDVVNENYLSDLAAQWIGDFEKAGGKVVTLPAIPFTGTWNYCLGIKDQDLFPICHAGLVRSQILRLIAKNLFSDKQLKVHLAHGMTQGHDYSTHSSDGIRHPRNEDAFKLEFSHAFGIERETRFGKTEEMKVRQGIDLDMPKFFKENYYAYHSSQNKRIYLAFWNTGLSAIHKLWSVNVRDKSDAGQSSSALNGVTVVLIPEKDWISSAEPLPFVIKEILQQYEQAPSASASLPASQEDSPSVRREILWWAIGLNPIPTDWKEKLKIFYPEIFKKLSGLEKHLAREEVRNFFVVEAYRAAFWRFSTLFQPLVGHFAQA